jgi:hypothetical protein
MGERPLVSHFVGIEKVFALKRRMLAAHKSQKEWLDASQGMDAYLNEMEATGRAVGRMSGRFAIAEGFSRHSHLGFSPPDWDPLASLLGGDFHHGKETA